MPPVSQAQRRWAYWVLNNSRSKKLKKVAKDFIGHGVTDLPEKVEDGKAVEKALRLTAHQPFPVQAGARSQVDPTWHHEGTTANPMNERQRVVRNGDAMGVYQLSEDRARLNHFHVNDVRAVTRGGGRAAMEHLTRMADQHGVSLQLVAEPLNPGTGEGKKLTRRELRSWYHGFGFRPKQGDLMIRTPTTLEKSMGVNKIAQPMPQLTPEIRAQRAEGRRERGQMRRHAISQLRIAHQEEDPSDQAYYTDQYHYGMDDADKHLAEDRKRQRQENRAMTRMKKSNPKFYDLYKSLSGHLGQIEKSWFMERKVRFGSPTRDVNDGRLTTTAMADGTTRKVTTGPVRASRVPDAKRKPGALKKEVHEVVASDFTTDRAGETMVSPSASFHTEQLRTNKVPKKDTDTTKYTALRDGSLQAIRLFAKALAARLSTN